MRLAKGEPNVDVQLLNRLHELASSQSRQKPVSKQRRTVAELIKSEQEEIEREKEQQRKAAEKAKIQELEALKPKESVETRIRFD